MALLMSMYGPEENQMLMVAAMQIIQLKAELTFCSTKNEVFQKMLEKVKS